MNRRRTLCAISPVVIMMCLSISACGSDSSSGGTGGGGGQGFRCVDACAAITDAEAKDFLGGVDQPGGTAGKCIQAADATNSSCNWKYSTSTTETGLLLAVSSESDATFKTIQDSQKLSPGYQEIPGIGDAAFKGTLGVGPGQGEIFFRVSDLTFQLMYTDGSGTAPANLDQQLQTEATAIVGRAGSL